MAGFRPGLGRGGITHSLVVTEPGRPGLGDMADTGFIGIAGAKFGAEPAGEPADDGVDIFCSISSSALLYPRDSSPWHEIGLKDCLMNDALMAGQVSGKPRHPKPTYRIGQRPMR
jgi:hypothetical protein